MNINKANLMIFCNLCQEAKFLLSIHLNDNGITMDNDLMYELLDIFGLEPKDIPLIKKNE